MYCIVVNASILKKYPFKKILELKRYFSLLDMTIHRAMKNYFFVFLGECGLCKRSLAQATEVKMNSLAVT